MDEGALQAKSGDGRTALLLVVLACVVFDRLLALYAVDTAWFAQNDHNLLFAGKAGLGEALAWSQKTWPPLYPVLLWTWGHAGLPLGLLNEVLWFGVLALLARLARRHVGPDSVGWALLLAAVFGPHALIVRQRTAEALFVLCALLACERLLAYGASRRARDVLLLGLAAAGVGLSRYFGILWLFPVLGLGVLLARGAPLRRRLAHAALFALVAGLPVLSWLAWVRHETSHLTGLDRFDATRLAEVQEHTTLRGNLELTAKTLWIDLVSDHGYAKARREGYRPSALDDVSLAVLLVATGLVLGAAFLRRRAPPAQAQSPPRPPPFLSRAAPRLLAVLCASFFAVLLAVWTLGNNDPLNTRFLFPVYPFLLLLGFSAHDAWRSTDPGRVALYAARGAFLWLLAVNLLRHAREAGVL